MVNRLAGRYNENRMETNEIPDQFSLVNLYSGNRRAWWIDRFIVGLLILLIIGSPLPFGSVQYFSITAIEGIALLSFLFWMFKLATCGDPEALDHFRMVHAYEKRQMRQFAFFHRH